MAGYLPDSVTHPDGNDPYLETCNGCGVRFDPEQHDSLVLEWPEAGDRDQYGDTYIYRRSTYCAGCTPSRIQAIAALDAATTKAEVN